MPQLSHFNGEPIRAREIAAIVRLADELAEGQQRTSHYMRKHKVYSTESLPYHDYAGATNITIDGGNERVAVTYQFKIRTKNGTDHELSKLKNFLDFAFRRLAKLDLERQYARFHCAKPLAVFQKISVCLDVHVDGDLMDPPFETTISDEVNLDKIPELFVADASWSSDAIVDRVRKEVLQRVGNGRTR